MGNICKSEDPPLTVEECEKFAEKLFLTNQEILTYYKIWTKVSLELDESGEFVCYSWEPEAVPHFSGKCLSSNQLLRLPALNGHSWGERILRVFAKNIDASKNISYLGFEEFLEMASAFHYRTPDYIKHYYYFMLCDHDRDDSIGSSDVTNILRHICVKETSDKEIASFGTRIMNEADIDGGGDISRAEFCRIINRLHNVSDNFIIDFTLPCAFDGKKCCKCCG